MYRLICAIALLAALSTAPAAPIAKTDKAPIEVVILGTFHFDNPGQDIANTQVDDVLAPRRQAEIGQILDGLARFKPTKVLVESQRRQQGTNFSERYPLYRTGKMDPSRNEIVQIGFALAARMGHQNVYAIDIDGDFPFEEVMAFAKKTGHEADLAQRVAAIQAWTADVTNKLKSGSIGQVLREFNDPVAVAQGNEFYLETLKYGALEEQPGANLVSAWYKRNFNICARIVQEAVPGDRLFVLYGSGHSYLLRHCLSGMPGYRIVEANGYLPK